MPVLSGAVTYAYARISTSSQNLDGQVQSLREYGFDKLFTDTASGTVNARERPGLAALLAEARAGDTLVIRELSRIGRTSLDVISTVQHLREERGIRLIVQNLGDLSGPMGNLLVTVLSAVSQLERELTAERAALGREAARLRGVTTGRRPSLTPAQVRHARELADGGRTSGEITALIGGVSQRTVQRAIAQR